VTCFGGNDGFARAIGSGGTKPYSFLWNTQPNQIDSSGVVLPAGQFIVTLTDVRGCEAQDTVIIMQPDSLGLTITTTPDSGQSDGTATVDVTGGTLPYTYAWQPPVSTDSTASGLVSGSYTVSVTDANGCSTSRTFDVDLFDSRGNSLEPMFGLDVYPVPAGESVTLRFTDVVPAEFGIVVHDAAGQRVLEERHGNNSAASLTLDVSRFAIGTYSVSVQTPDAAVTKRIVISR
jgi:hypothetical protein